MSDGRTRRDETLAGQGTRRDSTPATAPTRLDRSRSDLTPTVRETPGTLRDEVGEDRLQRTLPSALAARFRTVEELPAAGSEADILVVEAVDGGDRYIAKIYRRGLEPKTSVLQEIAASAPEHVVRLFEHGQSGGRWFELLEYCPCGSLRDLIKAEGPRVAEGTVREVLRELMEALAHLHSRNIIHKDVKPDNILIRQRLPLDLVLTDFGISSIVEGTSRYSAHASRTVRYAAPEAGAGFVSAPLDYWSLGMTIVEMLVGEHPFAKMSDQAISKHLSTRPVPLEVVEDDFWRILCRGLLTRDDQQRWGRAEIDRWLAGDRTLTAVADEWSASSTRTPYRWAGEEYPDPSALARALARRWDEAEKELARGYIRKWVWEDLRDVELTRFLDNLDEDGSLGIDAKLFRVIMRFAPGLSPTYKGYALTSASLRDVALQAVQGNAQAQEVITRIYAGGVFAAYSEITGKPEGAELEGRWREALTNFKARRADAIAAGAAAGDEGLSPDNIRATLLLGVTSPEYVGNLRRELTHVVRKIAGDCAWFSRLGNPHDAPVGTLLAMSILATAAQLEADRRRAAAQAERRAATAAQRTIATWTIATGLITGVCFGVARYFLAAITPRLEHWLLSFTDEPDALAACGAFAVMLGLAVGAICFFFRSGRLTLPRALRFIRLLLE